MGLFAILGVALIAVILWDVFETIILPRRVTRRFRLARAFYRWSWRPWRFVACALQRKNLRDTFLSYYGPLSLLMLFVVWAVGLIFGFATLHYSAGSAINLAQNQHPGFWSDLYMSGTTFFTLGLGDVTPRTEAARIITVFEAGLGFGFLAIVISYLPVLYGAFSRREVDISLLDARAGSPPSASEMLRRTAQRNDPKALEASLHDWEKWSAEMMESHLSYPVLCFFRSQHNNQSWLAALVTVLDVSALLIAYGQGALKWQAKLTFAISRHALVDLAQVLNTPPRNFDEERLPPAELQRLRTLMISSGLSECCPEDDHRFAEMRRMYEPYARALSDRLLMPIGKWAPAAAVIDNWRTSAWARISTAEFESSPLTQAEEKEHF
ncbi:MAG TPA: potassium channel family protein [Candidatus Acidoferrales bacterium]|nr:potassium channel family protein [Candidatus Acidoferrales bacterium]